MSAKFHAKYKNDGTLSQPATSVTPGAISAMFRGTPIKDAVVEITGNLITFTVAKVYGLGKMLPVAITAKGASFQENLYVNFTGAFAAQILRCTMTAERKLA